MPLSSKYPSPIEETIHDVIVRDPCRWLEDRNHSATEDWITEQRARWEEYLAGCGDLGSLATRVKNYLDTDVVDQPVRVADRYFYRRRDRGHEQGSIYVCETATGQERLLVDPSEKGPFVSVGIHQVSADGSLLAYEVRNGGEEQRAIRIVDVETGSTFPDVVGAGIIRGFSFSSNKRGFYYCREAAAAAQDHAICFHGFQTAGEDRAIFRATRVGDSRLFLISDDVHLGRGLFHRKAWGCTALEAAFCKQASSLLSPFEMRANLCPQIRRCSERCDRRVE
jgi:prolyl oligopeptidase